MIQQSLFAKVVVPRPNWRPQELPSLAGVRRIALDTESTSLKWYNGAKMVGFSICLPDGSTYYFPIRHAGGNLPIERVYDWCHQELRDKEIDFFNGPYDLNVMHMEGIDLEAQGCTFSDAGFWAALDDDHRYQASLDSVSREYLGYGKKPDPGTAHMGEIHAAEAEEYARWDPYLVHMLRGVLMPRLEAQDLLRVLQLENECLPATAEMIRNGAYINEELLDSWLASSEREYVQSLWDLHADLGRTVNPKSIDDMKWIFDKCGLKYPTKDMPNSPDFGKVTFEKRYIQNIDHPTIRKVRRTNRLANLRSKYLIPYKEELKKYGKVRYALHQMRTGGDDAKDPDAGTRFGRYSSSADTKTGDGVNIQQVAGKKFEHSVKEEVGWQYWPRQLFIPENKDWYWCCADADQIEYRWFAHYAQPPTVMAAYAADPATNFHKITHELIRPVKDITYELTKDCNFAGLYLAGPPKFSWMIGIPLKEGRLLHRAYHDAVPEVQVFGKKCMRVAENRGYVKTFLGRRARFPGKQHLNAAPNRVIQGSAGDEMKTKTVALRKAKLPIRLRFVVHDEVNADVPNREVAEEVSKVLNTQILQTRVPLRWTVKVGPNWQESKK